MNEAVSERHSDDLLRCTGETKEGWLLQAVSGEYEILRKDTIAGKCAFSLFSVYSCDFSLFQFTVCFFACKGTMRRKGGLGNSGTSREMKTLTGKWLDRGNGRGRIIFGKTDET